MKLYLSSHRVPNPDDLFAILPKPAAACKLVIIPNAKDYKLPNERATSLDELVADLQLLGFLDVDITDLRDYEDTNQLREHVKSYDVLYMAGGNSFVLRAELRRSGMDQFLAELLEAGMIYCGESAGAIVAGLSLQGAEVGDDPQFANPIIWEGLGFTERIIAPHADNPDFLEYINHMKKLYHDDSRVLYLNDNQAVTLTT